MNIATQTEVLLRRAGYETWTALPSVVCFENAALIGFVHVFPSVNDLMTRWREELKKVLSEHSQAIRAAGAKAWNVYSVFLTEEQAPAQQQAVERIEEDFALTRKIARAGVRTQEDLERVFLPLTAVRAQPLISETDFEDRLRTRLSDIPRGVLTAFLGMTSPEEVARILMEKP